MTHPVLLLMIIIMVTIMVLTIGPNWQFCVLFFQKGTDSRTFRSTAVQGPPHQLYVKHTATNSVCAAAHQTWVITNRTQMLPQTTVINTDNSTDIFYLNGSCHYKQTKTCNASDKKPNLTFYLFYSILCILDYLIH